MMATLIQFRSKEAYDLAVRTAIWLDVMPAKDILKLGFTTLARETELYEQATIKSGLVVDPEVDTYTIEYCGDGDFRCIVRLKDGTETVTLPGYIR